jgi:hypothetical protein
MVHTTARNAARSIMNSKTKQKYAIFCSPNWEKTGNYGFCLFFFPENNFLITNRKKKGKK